MKKHINLWLVIFLALSLALPIYSMAGNLLNIFTTDGYYFGIPYKSLFVDEAGNVTAMTNGTRANIGTDLSEPVITISNFSGSGVTGDNSAGIVTGTKSNPLTFYVVATDTAGIQSLLCLFPSGAFTPKDGSISEGTFQKTYDTAGTYYATFEASATENSKTYYTQRMIKINITDSQVQQYTVTTSANLAGAAATLTGAGTYNAAQSVTVATTAASGYTFNNWTEGTTPVSSSASYTFTINATRNLVANFTSTITQQYTVSTSVNPSGAGTVSGAGTYNAGASVTVTATPSSSTYTFSNWTEGTTPLSTSASYTFTINATRNLVANFTSSITPPPSSCTPPTYAQPINLDYRYVMSFSSGETVFSVSVTASQITRIKGQVIGLSGETDVVGTWTMPDCKTFMAYASGTDNGAILDIRSLHAVQPNINNDYIPVGNHTFKIKANAPSSVIIWFTTY